MRASSNDRAIGCLLGLACGDAVGTTLEFCSPGSFEPISDMIGGGPFDLKPGEWTDDTSMSLCLAESLLQCDRFDARDQIERYIRWWQEGYLSSTGTCFDIGGTVSTALRSYAITGNPLAGSNDEFSAGNGSIMRLAPVPIFYKELGQAVDYSGQSSLTTHGAQACVDACRLLGFLLFQALNGLDKASLLHSQAFEEAGYNLQTEEIRAISYGCYLKKEREDIRGTGYVVQSLEAALWCFSYTTSFADCILMAANLGDDADTTAAIAGQLAGAFYGKEGIPESWQKRLHKGEYIIQTAKDLNRAHIK